MNARLEVISRATEIIEGGWTQGAYARGVDGLGTSTGDPDADGHCSVGAIQRAVQEVGNGSKGLFMECLGTVAHQAGVVNLATWNDHPGRSHSEVKEIFRRARASVGGEAGVARELVAA